MKNLADPITPTTGSGGGVTTPPTNAPNILHIGTELNVSHGVPPVRCLA